MGAVFSSYIHMFQRSSTQDPELQNKLASLARQALERAEELKGILPQVEEKPTSHVSVQPKLCSVPEHASPNITVRATAATNRGNCLQGYDTA
jgi:hypothetical protein